MRIKMNKKRVFIVAELSANHKQNYGLAVETIKAAKEAGADAIKIQTYTADTITMDCNNKYFQINNGTKWDGQTLYELYKKAYTPWEWQPKLKKEAEKIGLIFFSSPFDKIAVDFLEEMNIPIYKIASPEITDIPLIEYIASKGKPIFISTGVANLQDIKEAINACRRKGNNDITILKCTSGYPTPLEEVNLKTLQDIAKKFKVNIGISDHTLGTSIPIAAVALGAQVVEKHFILDRKIESVDSFFSLEPKEFKEMVNAIREVEKGMGKVTYKLTNEMKKGRRYMRSLFIIEDMKKGEMLTEKNVKSIRPGNGLHPKYFKKILGKTIKQNIKKGTPLEWGMI
jgi:pseudaminic acid synthase